MKIEFANSFWKSLDRLNKSQSPLYFIYWKQKWYDLKYAIKNLIKYFWIVCRTRNWDYKYILEMMRFQLKDLFCYIDKYGHEEQKSRYERLDQIKQAISFLDSKIEFDYLDKVGWEDKDYNSFKEMLGDKKFSEYCAKADELENKEWKNLWSLISDKMRGWWD